MSAETTLADLLVRRRAARFVGREVEQAVFAEILGGSSPARLVWVHGPGGVGKSSLLQVFQALAMQVGGSCGGVDFKTVEPRPDAFRRELAAGAGTEDDPVAVVTLDTFERAAALEGWLHDEWLPGLPAGTIVVVASRRPPAGRWRGDEGWRDLLTEIRLRNFNPEETRAYLRGCGIDERQHQAVARLTHGHPLALSLVADLARQGSGKLVSRLEDAPDLLAELVRRLVETVPDSTHRQALELCAHAWMTSEGLLTEVLETADAPRLLEWLRGLSLVEAGPYGVFPHDLARDVIDADLRWRDPAGYADLHRRVHRASVRRAQVVSGVEQQRAIMQVVHAHRHSATAGFWDFDELGSAYGDALRTGDAEHLLRMACQHQGQQQADLVAHWLERQPEGFRVVRTQAPAPAGFLAVLRLDLAERSDLAVDPTLRAAADAIARQRPLRTGEHATVMRFVIDADRNQAPSRTLNLGPVLSIQTLLGDPAIAWDVLTWSDSGAMDPLMEFIDYQRLPGAEHRVGSTTYAAFGRDFRRGPLTDWFGLLADRELGAPVSPQGVSDDGMLALSFTEFATSVGQAFKDLHRRDRLAANPLCRSRLVLDDDGAGDPADRLASALGGAVAALAEHPRDAPAARALDRTYLRPAPTQEAAAEVLGLPFSTYRRHLTRGVKRAVELLWQREVGDPKVSRNRSGE